MRDGCNRGDRMSDPFDTTPAPPTMESRLRALLNSMNSAILEVDNAGSLVHANPFARKIMADLPPTPSPPSWETEWGEMMIFRDVHGAPLPPDEGPLFNALRTGEPQYDFRFSIEHPNGRVLHLMGTAEPLFGQDGRVSGAICSYQDMTELIVLQRALESQLDETKNAHQDIRLAHTELSRAHNLQAGFIANFSHDLRTPLSGVLGFADLLAISPAIVDDDEKEYLQEIIDSGDSLRMMIDSVITYSNILSGTVRIIAEWHEVDKIVELAAEPARRMCRRRGLEFRLELENAPERIRVDELRLQEVLEQLLDNAVKFTETGEVCLHVTTLEDQVVFEVRDTGPGISAEAELRLFEPYSKTLVKDGQLRRGVGLGLTLVKALVELMQGRVDYVTSLGRGTTFSVRLPIIYGAEFDE
jgi:two-component system CheB/CheR fusion protein